MSDGVPTWKRAIHLLEEGERSRAVSELLDNGEPPADAQNREADRLLRELLGVTHERDTPRAAAGPAGEIPAAVGTWLPEIRSLRALLEGGRAIREGRALDAMDFAREAEGAAPADASYLRLRIAGLYQAAFRFTGMPDLHSRGLAISYPLADRVESPAVAVLARGIMSTMHHTTGDLHASNDIARSAIELAVATGLAEHPHVALAHQFRGLALFEWNDLDAAEGALHRAWDLSGPEGRGVRSGVARVLASVANARGDHTEAQRWFERLEEVVAEPMTLRNREWLAAVRIRHGSARHRDLRLIDSWRQRYGYDATGLRDLPESERPALLGEFEHLTAVLEATSQWEELRDVSEALTAASRPARRWFTVRGLCGQAVAAESLGHRDKADELFEEALQAGTPGGFVRAYGEGRSLRRVLLRRARQSGDVGQSATRVLEALGEDDGRSGVQLTPKQSDVLKAVARGLTNRGVAESLGTSESTVRTHLRAVFRTLSVGSRTHAVAEARRLGLID